MSIRSLLRALILVIGVVVVVVVYVQWRPRVPVTDGADRVIVPDPDDRPFVSRTEGLDFTQFTNGRPEYTIKASENVGFVDGMNEWTGGVELLLYDRSTVETPDPLRVTGDRMRTRGDHETFDEVRIVGDVVVQMPNGATFETRRLDYDASTATASTCSRNVLVHAGLEIRSDCLYFGTESGDLRLTGGLTLKTADTVGEGAAAEPTGDLPGDAAGDPTEDAAGDPTEDAADDPAGDAPGEPVGLPTGVTASAAELRTRTGSRDVVLEGDPRVDVAGSTVTGESVLLVLDESSDLLTGLQATGEARAVLRHAEDSGSYVLRGDRVTIELGADGSPSAVTAEPGPGGETMPNLMVPEQGRLTASRILVTAEGGATDRGIEAEGAVRWNARGTGTILRDLAATTLRLNVGSSGIERVDAGGGVTAWIAGSDPNEADEFRGEELQLRWADGILVEGSWPSGVGFRVGSRLVTAALATYVAEARAWTVAGDPRPRVEAPDLVLEAASMTISLDGVISASGGVEGELAEERLDAVAFLFATADRVQVSADGMRADDALLSLYGSVRIWWEDQILLAERVDLLQDPARLQATGDVYARIATPDVGIALAETETEPTDAATDPPDDALVDTDTGAPPGLVLTAGSLLAEGDPPVLRIASEARLEMGQRTIQGTTLVLSMAEGGGVDRVEATGDVEFVDPAGTASGDRLEYDRVRDEVLLFGNERDPARFAGPEVTTESAEALRLVWGVDAVVIEATERGRTRTTIAPREAGEEDDGGGR